MQASNDNSDAEIRLMGLILAQSALIGLSVGVYDAGIWLNNDDAMVNGFTYAMAGFFVQGIAYYFFKMFFEQNMQERVQMQNIERQRQQRYRSTQLNFDNRRADMEMRMQEAQLERELQWMEQNPGKMPPSWGVQGGSPSMVTQYDDNMLIKNPPKHEAILDKPMHLGAVDEKKSQ